MPAAEAPVSAAEAALLFEALSSFPALALAVSGGPDSTALLWLVARWRDGLEHPPKLIAVTVDHGLRKESAREALTVTRLATTLGVAHRSLRWTGKKPAAGLQEAARNARYRLLAGAARKAGARHLLTAHTLDDQAETILLRLARGSGVSGLAGMGAIAAVPVAEGKGILLVRPLLDIPKTRLIATLEAARIPFADDPSNRDPRFTRPRLRQLMPALASEGLTAARLVRLARRVERVEDTLFKTLNVAQMALWPGPWSPGDPATIDRRAFLDLPGEIGLRLLQRMIILIGNEGPPELSQLETLHADLRQAGEPIRLGVAPGRVRRTLAGALITFSGTKLTVEQAPPRRAGAKPRKSGRKAPFTKLC